MVALDEWSVDELAAPGAAGGAASPSCPTTCSTTCSTCSRAATRPRSSPSCGPASCGTASTASSGPAPGPSASPSPTGGTIPDRGLFGVFLPDGTRVGELDEEMVYESRPGETFLLGASTWRIEDITFERVIVTPAPGQPGKMPFWHGDRPGRPLELGRALGAFVREIRGTAPRGGAGAAARATHGLDAVAAGNLRRVPRRAGRGHRASVPDDRTDRGRALPRRDRRLAGVHPHAVRRPGARAVGAWRSRPGWPSAGASTVEMMWSDDGIVMRLPEAVDDAAASTSCCSTPTRSTSSSSAELPDTALFAGAVPRVRGPGAAAAAPPARPAHPAVAAAPAGGRPARGGGAVPELPDPARDHPRVPATTCSTCRRCARCWPTCGPGGSGSSRSTRRTASPFAQSLLFGWIAVYMYEGDAPLAERRAAALALDRDLLRDLLGAEELRELLDPGVLADLELELQRLADGRRARDADELHDLLRRLGALSRRRDRRPHARADRPRPVGVAAAASPSAGRSRVPRRRRRPGRRGRGRRRGSATRSAWPLPLGLPAAFTDPVPTPLGRPRRPATPAPTARSRRRGRRPARASPSSRAAAALGGARGARAGSCAASSGPTASSASGATSTCCASCAAARWPRCAARSSRSSRPRSPGSSRRGRASAPPGGASTRWSRRRPAAGGAARRRRCSRPTCCRRGSPATARPTSTRCAPPARWCGSAPAPSAPPTAGCGSSSATRRACSCPTPGPSRRAARRARARRAARPPRRSGARRSGPTWSRPCSRRPALRRRRPCSPRCGTWCGPGEVTNDSLAPLRAVLVGGKARERRGRRAARPAGRPGPARPGSARPPARGPVVAGRAAARARARRPPRRPTPGPLQLLERYGVLTREAALAEGVEGGFAAVYPVLQGAGGAGPGPPRLLRRRARRRAVRPARRRRPAARVRARRRTTPTAGSSCWPPPIRPSPTAPRCRGPRPAGRPARAAGALVVLVDGEPVVFLERGGRSLWTFPAAEAHPDWAAALAGRVAPGWRARTRSRRSTATGARTSSWADGLRAAGFVDGYRGLVRR